MLGLFGRVKSARFAADIAELTPLSDVGLVHGRFAQLGFDHSLAVRHLEPSEVAVPTRERKVAAKTVLDVDPLGHGRRKRRSRFTG